jgi:hypothetical protein
MMLFMKFIHKVVMKFIRNDVILWLTCIKHASTEMEHINSTPVSWKISCIVALDERRQGRFSSHYSLQLWVSVNLTSFEIFFMYLDSNFTLVDHSFIYSLKHIFMIH